MESGVISSKQSLLIWVKFYISIIVKIDLLAFYSNSNLFKLPSVALEREKEKLKRLNF